MTIETAVVKNRPAIVSYLNDRFEPVEKTIATLVKVNFTDDEAGAFFAVVDREPARVG